MDICNQKFNSYKECWWNLWLWRTVPIFQLVFGTFGNIMNITILSRKRFYQNSTSVYLICLAVADSSALWTAISVGVAFNGFGIDLPATSQIMCKTMDWLTYTSGGFSIWLLVLLTTERLILVRYPAFSRLKLTRRQSIFTAIIRLLVIGSVYAHLPFGFEAVNLSVNIHNATVTKQVCIPGSVRYESFYKIASWRITLILFNSAPITIMVVGNGVIIATILLQRKGVFVVNPEVMVRNRNRIRKEKSSTRMIFLINALFILTTVPFGIKKTWETFSPPINNDERVRSLLTDSALTLLVYSNYTFNFLLYCMSGTIFNEELKAFIKESKHNFVKLCFSFSLKSLVVIDSRDSSASRTFSTAKGVVTVTEL